MDELTEAISLSDQAGCDTSVTFSVHEIRKQAEHLSSTECFDDVMSFVCLSEKKMQALLGKLEGATV